ncbi:MAG: hydroxymethylglutaryl-CoA reductase, degradative [Flavobacteriaceae bacterium]|nr:hydroxymethylglutaryl-CoA reductase, degradative [Flavobacteriaceae bacterium]|tara:strand:+ start:892 stop:2199 length:1308 start_codon:yes stop_codon:yes gene_type:complete
MKKQISGFSKLSKIEKIDWVTNTYFNDPQKAKNTLRDYWNSNIEIQNKHDEFIENTLSNFYIPLGVAPNFIINGKNYTLPMAIEESSVVAAAANAAKYWSSRGGFKSKVLGIEKVGQIHFLFNGKKNNLVSFFNQHKKLLHKSCEKISTNMNNRGGGILSIDLVDKTFDIITYFQISVTFNTVDSMGANYINSCLEKMAFSLKKFAKQYEGFTQNEKELEIIMSIMSNYVPNCLVKSWVKCSVDDLNDNENISPKQFADKFIQAVNIANKEPYRAVTHNKGIMNGVDALALATGNDFRAIEAGVHSYASKDGVYKSLSSAYIKNNVFNLEITLPISIGTVGGLTKLHPLVNWSLNLLNNPNSRELMEIISVAGLAQNFAAIRSLITSGIQKGHMKMHLLNILNQLNATKSQKIKALEHFKNNIVNFNNVRNFLKI